MDGMIVGMGEALWDILPDGRKIGGAPANFAYHVSQFGLPGCVVSAVGDDAPGDEIIENFNNKGLNQYIEKVPYPTGSVLVDVDDAGIPRYDIKENVAWDNIPFTPTLEELARHTKALCFGSLSQRSSVSRDTVRRFIDTMEQNDETLVVFDINLRQHYYSREVLEESLKRCNILKINDEELDKVSELFGLSDADVTARCRKLMERFNLKMLILTCGAEGSYVFTSDGMSYMPTPRVAVADTVGAGDSFTAAFIASLIKGKSVTEAHEAAVRTSAYVCTQNGAMPLLPDELTD
ncbi:MAG: carbohydrate kinase [Muribaculaceae bacterium]|nr:carbohydrate kinase [Muribaculaceae bacterium]